MRSTDGDELRRVSFRMVYGGPDATEKIAAEISRLRGRLSGFGWQYDIDFLVRVSGSITPIHDPSGLYNPRVSVSKRTVTGNILISQQDLTDAADPALTTRQVIYAALDEVFDRVSKRDREFDASKERAQLSSIRQT